MRSLLDAASVAWLRPVAQYRARDAAELDALLEAVVAGSGEGLMLQHQDARYRVGRSGGLLKYKPYDDAQARVVGPTPDRCQYHRLPRALAGERPDRLPFRHRPAFPEPPPATPPPVAS